MDESQKLQVFDKGKMWQNSIMMKYCSTAEITWPTNLVLKK